MKAYLFAACAIIVGCGSAPKPSAETKTTSAAMAESTPAAPSTATAPAATAVPEGKKLGDPLALDGAIGALPKIVFTPAKELRKNSRADLASAFDAVSKQETHAAAAAFLAKRLGKPSWVENGQKRVWVASERAECQRLTLMSDGSVDLEGATKSEWTMLSTFARQNKCSGEITEEPRD
jgi:hypothetical protein